MSSNINNLTLEDLIIKVNEYNPGEEKILRKAYQYADKLHQGQYRKSGEPYIIHPLQVAYILANLHADRDTLVAALLHDTVEDTGVTKEDISENFNNEIAKIVDGVTKLTKMNFDNKEDLNFANNRKVLTGLIEDTRIIIVKLADRLHNMRTLEFQKPHKQKEKAEETMEIYVPLAHYLGMYDIKNELEDLSLKYLKPDIYKALEDKKISLESDISPIIQEMLFKISCILSDEKVSYQIKTKTKNIYSIYKSLNPNIRYQDIKNLQLSDVHDLHALKVILNEVNECYQALGWIHKSYHPMEGKIKDYICNPKTNLYQSIHTTVFGPKEKLVQIQIRTFEMECLAERGLTHFWDINKGEGWAKMQEYLNQHSQFLKSLIEIEKMSGNNNKDFMEQIEEELSFEKKINVYTTNGDIIELPLGATPIDFAYKIHSEIGNKMVAVMVNDKMVPIDYILTNNDRVKILTDNKSTGPQVEWLDLAKTKTARKRIKENIKEEYMRK